VLGHVVSKLGSLCTILLIADAMYNIMSQYFTHSSMLALSMVPTSL